MIRINASVDFIGDNFKPGLAEIEGNFLFTEKSELGAIGKLGVYKSKQIPFGYTRLRAPPGVTHGERISWLAKFLEDKIGLIRKYNANDIYFEIGYFHDGRCNCELTVDEIKAIAKLEIPYSFSTYRVENLDKIS